MSTLGARMDIFDLRRHNLKKKQIMEGVGKRTRLDVGPNILNLKQWIPQNDVIKLILKRLNKVDWKLVWAAHNKRHEQELIQNNEFWWLCVHEGYLKVLMWGDGLGVQCFRSTILDIAAQKGYIEMFW